MSTPSAYKITNTHVVDLTNTSLEQLSRSPNQFNRLSDSELDEITDGILDKVGIECFAQCWADLCKWKENNLDSVCSVERLFKQATGSKYSVRRNLGRRNFDSTDELFANTVMELSRSLSCYPVQTDSESDSRLVVYRGISYEIPYIVARAIDDPTSTTYSIPVASVMANYTPDKTQAAGYSPIIFRKEVDASDIFIAADYMLTHSTKEEGLLTTDAECRVTGDATSAVDDDAIIIVDREKQKIADEYSVQSFFGDMPTPEHPMHEHFTNMVQDVSIRIKTIDDGLDDPRDPLIVSSDSGKDRLERWCDKCMKSDNSLKRHTYKEYTDTILDN